MTTKRRHERCIRRERNGKVFVACEMPIEQEARLAGLATVRQVSKSDLIREAVALFLARSLPSGMAPAGAGQADRKEGGR